MKPNPWNWVFQSKDFNRSRCSGRRTIVSLWSVVGTRHLTEVGSCQWTRLLLRMIQVLTVFQLAIPKDVQWKEFRLCFTVSIQLSTTNCSQVSSSSHYVARIAKRLGFSSTREDFSIAQCLIPCWRHMLRLKVISCHSMSSRANHLLNQSSVEHRCWKFDIFSSSNFQSVCLRVIYCVVTRHLQLSEIIPRWFKRKGMKHKVWTKIRGNYRLKFFLVRRRIRHVQLQQKQTTHFFNSKWVPS